MNIESNIKRVIRQIHHTQAQLDSQSAAIRDELSMKLLVLAKEEIKGKRRPGERATIGEPPKNRTANLRKSIRAQKFREGFHTYVALVGPTVIYGRSLEVGGKFAPRTWPEGARYPFMEPAFLKFKKLAPYIVRKHLGRIKP